MAHRPAFQAFVSGLAHASLTAVLLLSTAWAEPLAAPKHLTVSNDGSVFKGRWEAVPGASYYEVWTRQYGNWRFNEKDHETSPFTSSFELPGSDDRMRFKVRAVSGDGQKGDFSEEAQATVEVARPVTSPGASTSTGAGDGFDVEAPPPKAPTSLFAVWTEPREIRLVWQSTEKADHYIIEELKDGKWTSVVGAEFPKATTAILKNKPAPGPYQFRVRAVGRNGRASEPSRATTAKR